MGGLDATHDPELKSWVESANVPASDFPIQNLPFGVFRRKGTKENPRGGVAIGDQVLDLAALGIETGPTLNEIAAAGPSAWRRLRKQISKALSVGGFKKGYSRHVVPMKRAELFVPMAIGDQVLDLAALGIETGPTLNEIAAAGPSAWRRLRKQISKALSVGGFKKGYSRHVVPMKRAELFVPMAIGDYTDFYTGIYHATTIGKLFRPDNPLLPNYKW